MWGACVIFTSACVCRLARFNLKVNLDITIETRSFRYYHQVLPSSSALSTCMAWLRPLARSHCCYGASPSIRTTRSPPTLTLTHQDREKPMEDKSPVQNPIPVNQYCKKRMYAPLSVLPAHASQPSHALACFPYLGPSQALAHLSQA